MRKIFNRHISGFDSKKNFGLAVYAAEGTDLDLIFSRISQHCDHLHIDLVDQTMRADSAPVDLQIIKRARELWTWQPFMLHIMSRKPSQWFDPAIQLVDAVLIHVDIEDDIFSLLAECRKHSKSPGIVAHHSVSLERTMPFLPHIDYLLVLGIEHPGQSGQKILPEALELAKKYKKLSEVYPFKLIFDGGVTLDNSHEIPAEFIVSASTVLQAEDPIAASLILKSGRKNAEQRST